MRVSGRASEARARSYEQGIEPHISVFDKSARTDGTFSRADFTYDQPCDVHHYPAGQMMTTTGTVVNDGATSLYRASMFDCAPYPLKTRCCLNEPVRKVPRSAKTVMLTSQPAALT